MISPSGRASGYRPCATSRPSAASRSPTTSLRCSGHLRQPAFGLFSGHRAKPPGSLGAKPAACHLLATDRTMTNKATPLAIPSLSTRPLGTAPRSKQCNRHQRPSLARCQGADARLESPLSRGLIWLRAGGSYPPLGAAKRPATPAVFVSTSALRSFHLLGAPLYADPSLCTSHVNLLPHYVAAP